MLLPRISPAPAHPSRVFFRSYAARRFPRDAHMAQDWPRVENNTYTRSNMLIFLGEQSVNGDHPENFYCYAPKNNVPKYLPQGSGRRNQALFRRLNRLASDRLNGNAFFAPRDPDSVNPLLHNDPFDAVPKAVHDEDLLKPFPLNPYVTTGFMLSDMLKSAIIKSHERGESNIVISQRYGIKLARVEATIKLAELERDMENEGKITPDMVRFDNRMKLMFPLTSGHMSQADFQDPDEAITFELRVASKRDSPSDTEPSFDRSGNDNIYEYVVPPKADKQIYQFLPEDEVITTDDAAKILGVESAEFYVDEMENLSTQRVSFAGVPEEDLPSAVCDWKLATSNGVHEVEVNTSKDRLWVFSSAKVGKVGYGYGARDDARKKYRKHKDTRLNYA
ncbi:eukaryotic mitochondrial regulator protein-domain-containing protein [Myxozyma melibiosi]|uniref:Eukaryotic mitochondrial regulator protein-domain-containing protein n=1 Tax=Myxozyma melibiosi TaxID=54550 RepID=A0ABR1FAV9_9ASCO